MNYPTPNPAPQPPQPQQYAPPPSAQPAPPAPQGPPAPQQYQPPQGPSWQYAQQPEPAPQQYAAPQQPAQPPQYAAPQYRPPTYQPPVYQPPAAPPQSPPVHSPAGGYAAQPGAATPPAAPAPAQPQPDAGQYQGGQYQGGQSYSPQQLAEIERAAYRAQGMEPPAQPAKRGPWDSLDFDEELESHARWDAEAGMYVPKGQYSSIQAVQRLNEIHGERQKRILNLTTRNPLDIIEEAGGKERVQAWAEEVFARRAAAMERAQIEQQFIAENGERIYARDQAGNMLRNPDGTPVLTQYGVDVVNTLSELETGGVADMRMQLALLNRLVPPPQPNGNGHAGNGNGNGNGQPQLFGPPNGQQPYSPQQIQQAAQQAFAPYAPYAPPVQPTLAQQAMPPSAYLNLPPNGAPVAPQWPNTAPQPPSQQQLFLQRAELGHAQNPGNYLPGTSGLLASDPTTAGGPPQQPFNPDGGYLLKSAIASGLIADPRNSF